MCDNYGNILVNKSFQPSQKIAADAVIRVDNVYAAISFLLEKFNHKHIGKSEISDLAFIHPTAKIGENVAIGAFSVI